MQEQYRATPKGQRLNGVDVTMFVDSGCEITLHAPREYQSVVGTGGGHVTSWILAVAAENGGAATLHLRTVDTMRRLHDTLGAALADIDGGAS